MITFLDERDVEHGALATIKVTNAVNGERSLTGEIESGDYVLANIERGWRLRFDDEFYVVTYAKPVDDGKGTHVTFDAVHQFFWDFDKSSVHDQLNDGSHTFLTYLDFIFAGSDYTYTIDPLLKVYAFEKQSFGYKSRLNLFNDIITASGVEFQVIGKVVRILEKTGTDLSTVVRKNFNMNELGIEKHIGDFVTYQKGFGAWVDENDHTKGRLVTEYTSPLASVYGKLEAEPLVDERYTQADNMVAALKANVDNSYSISITLDMEDLTRAGYDYTQPRAGDYIMAINETLDFQEKIRIVSFTSEYDVTGQLIKHEVTCNDIGAVKKLSASYNLTKEQAQNASDSVAKAVEMANKALVSADGKSTVYFGNEFPKDEPKGTLHKGDSLYLTVGDTTKMYYWTGADWEELPIVNDVEAFKEQIAEELKDVPNREEFEATIAQELATSKAELETQIDTAKAQAESNAKAYADEINQATAEIAEQANTTANSLKSDLAKVKTDLTATTSTANAAKTSASEAKQQLTTVANDLSKAKTNLQNAVSAVDAKATALDSDLTKTKSDIAAQAKKQTELTTRVINVETTANGTKTTVTQLSKTVDNLTGDVSTAKQSIKKVEDDVSGVYTTLSTLTVGGGNLLSDTTDFSMGKWQYTVGNSVDSNAYSIIDGAFHVDSTIAVWHQYQTYSPEGSSSTRKAVSTALANLKAGQPYILSFEARCLSGEATIWVELRENLTTGTNPARIASHGFAITEDWVRYSFGTDSLVIDKNHDFWRVILGYDKIGSVEFRKVKLEEATVASPWTPAYSDSSIELAEYKQSVANQLTSLSRKTEVLDGKMESNKVEIDTTVNGIRTEITELQAYKDDESVRAESYLTASRNETAKQITAERTNTSKNYVAKSTYTSDVTGIRNDLIATTTTANTTKTNLANYQASNDKAVANLQSSLQTTNGNVSSLQTKVEAVPGQITSAVSAVEGKIPTEVGGTNLINDYLFERGIWYYDTFDKNDRTYELVGDGVVQLTTTSSGWHQWQVKSDKATDLNSIETGTYTLSFYARSLSGTATIYATVRANQTTGTNPDYLRKNLTITNEWTRYVVSGNITKNADIHSYWRVILIFPGVGTVQFKRPKLEVGSVVSAPSPAVGDTVEDITSLSSELTQTKDGMTLLATKTELNTAKSDLQSGITTATNKANAAQSTADNNAKTISTHTTQISALNTGLSAKVSQTDFNTLSGRVTTAENNITAKANELSSKISSVEGQIPTEAGSRNYALKTGDSKSATGGKLYDLSSAFDDIADNATLIIEFDWSVTAPTSTSKFRINRVITYSDGTANQWNNTIQLNNGDVATSATSGHYSGTFKKIKYSGTTVSSRYLNLNQTTASGTVTISNLSIRVGSLKSDWQPAPEDYDSKLASAQSEIKQTTDAISASVSALDKSTVKTASLTINTDGIVMKAGKSTTDVANAIGAYFAVNQNAINLFSDKINVKANMIVDGAITSTKIASKTINTAHLNGKIITADVIATGAITADAIKAGAVTTSAMSANSINGDRITAGTLDAAKIKAGSITASQIASGTITSAQIKTGTISAGNIATGAITTDKIAANSINSDKIVSSGITANVIKGGKLQSLSNATNFELDTGKLFYNNNNTGIFRVQDNASTMGLKFSNTSITVSGTSRILSRVILGGDRRETTLDDGKWDQGGFTGIVAETINGVDSDEHAQADTLRVIGDNIYFTHSYKYDAQTKTNAQGWKMETFSPFSSYAGNVVLKPYGINYRQSDIITGDIRLDNGDGSGYWVRGCIRTLRNCFQHYLNGGTTSGAMNAIRDALKEISGV